MNVTMSLDPNDARFVVGTEADRKRAREDWHRQRFIAQVMGSGLQEIPRSHVEPFKFGLVEDTRNGRFYRCRRDALVDLNHTNATAFYVGHDGVPVLLEEPANGPQNRDELDAQQAERQERRAQREAAPIRIRGAR
jgi:hypothetical protein